MGVARMTQKCVQDQRPLLSLMSLHLFFMVLERHEAQLIVYFQKHVMDISLWMRKHAINYSVFTFKHMQRPLKHRHSDRPTPELDVTHLLSVWVQTLEAEPSMAERQDINQTTASDGAGEEQPAKSEPVYSHVFWGIGWYWR